MQLSSKLIEEWKELKNLKVNSKNISISDLFKNDPLRQKKFTCEVNSLTLDYSKNFINENIFNSLIRYLDKSDLSKKIDELMFGSVVNVTESKPALHSYFRDLNNKLAIETLESLQKTLESILFKIKKQNIKTIINIGIGGSHLGPELLYNSLKSISDTNINCFFVSNVDPENIFQILNKINVKETLFFVSSKSFTTDETLTNFKIAKCWLEKFYTNKDDINNKFYAITANKNNAISHGIKQENIILFNENIGGRYSIASAIAIPFIISSNFQNFKKFLEGMNSIDLHFKSKNFSENLPVILALIDFWYINFHNINNRAIIPYSYNLRNLPKYLQQLTMESNGKDIDNNKNNVLYNTSNIIWGDIGTNAQHSFFQMLHQGTNTIPCDFILPLKSNIEMNTDDEKLKTCFENSQKKLIANALAQIKILAFGSQSDDKHKRILGNKPSNTIIFEKITPETMGMLIALYEHKVFTLSVIWNINCFDQFGVEKGKIIANEILKNNNNFLNSKNLLDII